MKIFGENARTSREKREHIYMMKDHRGPERHMLPHERKALLNVELDEREWSLLKEIFGDEDTAVAAAEIIRESPPEIQILAIQLLNLIEEVA